MTTITPSSNTENETITKPIADTVLNGDKKEEESPSTEPQQINKENEASVANSADNQNEKELLKQGMALIQEDNYNEAALVLATAMELIQQKDIANCIDAVPYYLSYGEALLRLVQSSNDLFAAPVRQSQQQHLQELQNEEQEQEVEEPAAPAFISDAAEPVQPTDATNNDQETTEKVANGKEEVDDDEDDDLQQNAVESAGDIEQEQGGDVDTTDDREIAWESFEYARGIIEDYLGQEQQGKDDETEKDKYYEMLSRCHSFLGELLIEDENSEMALDEFEKALEIQDQCSSDYIKYRQRAFNHFMACLSAQYAQKDEVALKHCNISLRRSSERICAVLKEMDCTEEMKECGDYENVMKVAEQFMDKMDATEMKENGQELKELVGIMQDLMSKVEEVEQVIEAKKNQVVDNGDNGDVGALMDAQDPLQALINGLVGKFGIDEDVLGEEEGEDGMDGMDGNKNNGVTTIGFGNFGGDEDGDDEEVNDLGCFGKKKVERKAGKKRSMEDAEIVDDEVNAKKMKLNTGDAAVVENENEEAKK